MNASFASLSFSYTKNLKSLSPLYVFQSPVEHLPNKGTLWNHGMINVNSNLSVCVIQKSLKM